MWQTQRRGVFVNAVYFGWDPCIVLNILLHEVTVSSSVCGRYFHLAAVWLLHSFEKLGKEAVGIAFALFQLCPFPCIIYNIQTHTHTYIQTTRCRNSKPASPGAQICPLLVLGLSKELHPNHCTHQRPVCHGISWGAYRTATNSHLPSSLCAFAKQAKQGGQCHEQHEALGSRDTRLSGRERC